MSDAFISLVFAATGMAVVFVVICFITIVMIITGSIFSGRSGRTQGPRQDAAEEARVPDEHVVVIAAALAIHTMGRMKKIALMGEAGAAGWALTDRSRPGAVHVPRLRRTK